MDIEITSSFPMKSSTHLPPRLSSPSSSIVTPTPLTIGNYELNYFIYIMSILGSCKVLTLGYSGCCSIPPSRTCKNIDCFCDQQCYSNNDCCSDIADIGCHSSNKTLGKTKSDDHQIR